jgi:hypothetical protein
MAACNGSECSSSETTRSFFVIELGESRFRISSTIGTLDFIDIEIVTMPTGRSQSQYALTSDHATMTLKRFSTMTHLQQVSLIHELGKLLP